MIKKFIYSLITILLISPINVYAAGSVKTDVNSLKVEEGKINSFLIKVDNGLARANITSSDESVAILVNESGSKMTMNNWVSKESGEDKVLDHPIYVKGLKEGKATITVEVFDASTYDLEKLSPLNLEVEIEVTKANVTTTYTVTYDANDGKGAPSEQQEEVGKELTLSTTKPTREGYEFTGWNTSKDGKGTSYLAGSKYTEGKDVTLYAMWKETENVKKNPQTGDTLIYVVLLLTLGALIYSYWYMKKSQEN